MAIFAPCLDLHVAPCFISGQVLPQLFPPDRQQRWRHGHGEEWGCRALDLHVAPCLVNGQVPPQRENHLHLHAATQLVDLILGEGLKFFGSALGTRLEFVGLREVMMQVSLCGMSAAKSLDVTDVAFGRGL